MSKLEKLKEKARSLEAKDPKGAIEAWQHVLKGQEEDGDPNPDLAVFNRIGDLYLKVREPAPAADYYDQAVGQDAGGPPADVWRSGAAPRRGNGGARGAQASTA